jgi:chemotaxis protein methyltransferase CheR
MEQPEFIFFKRTARRLLDINLDGYKRPQVQRRLKNYLLRSGYPNWPTYFRAMKNDPMELARLRDYLTINVTSFFRDPKKYGFLRETIFPKLLDGHPKLRVWSAGCSRGHEPYSLAIALAETTSLYRKHQILATDIDGAALAFAQDGGPYSPDDVANVSPPLLERYFKVDGDNYRVAESLKRKIDFGYHNLLDDPIEGGFDLIVCRNVVIYFTAEAKTKLYKRFGAALRPGGVLFVGGTEIISNAREIGLESAGHSFYYRNLED